MPELAVVAVCVAAFLWVVAQIYTDMREHEEEARRRDKLAQMKREHAHRLNVETRWSELRENSAADECGWRRLVPRHWMRVLVDSPRYNAEADVLEGLLNHAIEKDLEQEFGRGLSFSSI